MDTRQITKILTYPDRLLVDHIVNRANLTKSEWEVICLRHYESETVESAAERLDVSPGTVKNRYRNGMKKLLTCWSAIPWIRNL